MPTRREGWTQHELMESTMGQAKKARAIGFNHVALEVGDVEEA
jgi:hypothetical protein